MKQILNINIAEINTLVNDFKRIKAVDAIILFGSYARGDQKPLSDIDICIITKKNISDYLKSKIHSYSLKKVDLSFFWDLPISVKYAIFREGKILFFRNADNLHSIIVGTMHQYLDFKHIIDKNFKRCFS